MVVLVIGVAGEVIIQIPSKSTVRTDLRMSSLEHHKSMELLMVRPCRAIGKTLNGCMELYTASLHEQRKALKLFLASTRSTGLDNL